MRISGLYLGVLCALAFAAGAARADRIVMIDDLELSGKIVEEKPNTVVIMVLGEKGRIEVPRARIKSIEYDFESKAAGVKEDDFKGLYDLGVWAMSKGMYKEAIGCFERAKGNVEGVTDVVPRLVKCYEGTGQLDKAYELVKNEALTHPDDAELKAQVSEIGKKLGIDAANPNAAHKIFEGIEGDPKMKWNGAPNWANPTQATVYTDKDTGNQMVQVVITPQGKDKAVFSVIPPKPWNMTDVTSVIFKAVQSGKTKLQIAVMLKNAKGESFESQLVTLDPGSWSKKSITFEGTSFKSDKSNWVGFKHELEGREDIREMMILVYNHGNQPVTMYFDEIFFPAKPAPKK